MNNLFGKFRDRFLARWVPCGIVPDKRSVQYGIRFSYPVYILIVCAGVILENPFIILVTAITAFLAIKLPMHPFDYIYNHVVARIIGTSKIPARGSELQVSSIISLIFNLTVLILLALGININYALLAIIYALASIYFIGIFLFKG